MAATVFTLFRGEPVMPSEAIIADLFNAMHGMGADYYEVVRFPKDDFTNYKIMPGALLNAGITAEDGKEIAVKVTKELIKQATIARKELQVTPVYYDDGAKNGIHCVFVDSDDEIVAFVWWDSRKTATKGQTMAHLFAYAFAYVNLDQHRYNKATLETIMNTVLFDGAYIPLSEEKVNIIISRRLNMPPHTPSSFRKQRREKLVALC